MNSFFFFFFPLFTAGLHVSILSGQVTLVIFYFFWPTVRTPLAMIRSHSFCCFLTSLHVACDENKFDTPVLQ